MGRFISADTIIPDPANPQAFNRYTYCINNPLKYIDPTGRDWMDYYDWSWFEDVNEPGEEGDKAREKLQTWIEVFEEFELIEPVDDPYSDVVTYENWPGVIVVKYTTEWIICRVDSTPAKPLDEAFGSLVNSGREGTAWLLYSAAGILESWLGPAYGSIPLEHALAAAGIAGFTGLQGPVIVVGLYVICTYGPDALSWLGDRVKP